MALLPGAYTLPARARTMAALFLDNATQIVGTFQTVDLPYNEVVDPYGWLILPSDIILVMAN